MLHQPQIPAALLSAYRNSTYIIDEAGASVRIGQPALEADRICRDRNAQCWLFITPYNPRSEVLSLTENNQRMDELRSVLRQGGFAFLEGEGQGEDAWEPERSLFVPGVSREFAIELGKRFEQYAVVFGEVGKLAELIEIPLGPKCQQR